MFSRLSLFGHVWSVEGVSIYTCRCTGSRQIQDVRFSLLSHVMSQIFSDEKWKGTRLGKMSSSVKRLRFRLSTVSNRAWMSTSEWPYSVSRRRTGWRVVFLETVLQTGEQVSNVFQGLENDLNRASSIRACVVLRSCFLSTGKVLAGGLLGK